MSKASARTRPAPADAFLNINWDKKGIEKISCIFHWDVLQYGRKQRERFKTEKPTKSCYPPEFLFLALKARKPLRL